ncbi:MAG TPA: hypothetical protein PKA63_08920 [Oligoflexia bacterium]|nr:hypothetical protein [Oligoflexia bacterium]HMP48773.1 hypothetical protein [Oligoflexia bacterium]
MKTVSGNWLLTFSDLFFILVAFFLLRHQLVEIPKEVNNHHQNSTISTIHNYIKEKTILTTPFQAKKRETNTSIDIPLDTSWFTESVELSSKGEEAIRGIAIKQKESSSSLWVELFVEIDQPGLNMLQKKMLEALSLELQIRDLPVSKVIVSSTRAQNNTGHGLIRLIFD